MRSDTFTLVLAAPRIPDVGSKVVTGGAYGVVAHDASERDDCDFGTSAAYIDNHVTFRRFPRRCLYR